MYYLDFLFIWGVHLDLKLLDILSGENSFIILEYLMLDGNMC